MAFHGSFHVCDFPLSCIAKDTIVDVYTIGGGKLLSWLAEETIDIKVASLSILEIVCKQENVPFLCANLIWVEVTNGVCTTKLVTRQLSTKDKESMFDVRTSCMVCGDLCENQDDPGAERIREENCYECDPECLCDLCRVVLLDGTPTCLECMNISGYNQLPETMRNHIYKRLKLLHPECLGIDMSAIQ